MGVIKIDAYFCDRCTHVWMPRENSVHRPLVCPRCKSPYWDRDRKNNPSDSRDGDSCR